MSYTYTWSNAEKTGLIRADAEGNTTFIPADPLNRDYDAFLSSGVDVAAYVAPSEPALTTEEKVNRLLSDYGLTRDEMSAALAAE